MNNTALPSRPTLIQRFQRHVATRAEARRNGESGLALLDVLLGMAIFGIIVIIGIQSVNQFRQRAFETTASSDAKQISVALESAFTDNQSYPAAIGSGAPITRASQVTQLAALGSNLSRGVQVVDYAASNADGDFSFCVVHFSGGTDATTTNVDAWSVYDSAVGAIVKSGRGLPTAATVNAGVTIGGGTTTPANRPTSGAGSVDCLP